MLDRYCLWTSIDVVEVFGGVLAAGTSGIVTVVPFIHFSVGRPEAVHQFNGRFSLLGTGAVHGFVDCLPMNCVVDCWGPTLPLGNMLEEEVVLGAMAKGVVNPGGDGFCRE